MDLYGGCSAQEEKDCSLGREKGINQAPDWTKQEGAVSCQEAVGPLIASVAPL